MDPITMIEKAVGYADKAWNYRKNKAAQEQAKREDAEMLEEFDNLRRSTLANGGNLLVAEIGSPKDRLYSKMVEKGKRRSRGANVRLLACCDRRRNRLITPIQKPTEARQQK